MKNISIIALEGIIDQLEQEKKAAVRKVAAPFDEKILQIRNDIAKILGTDTNNEQPDFVPRSYTGAKRGRKPKLITSFVYPRYGTVKSKLVYVIKEAGRFVTIGEIAAGVKIYEPNVNEDIIKIRFGRHIDKYKKEGVLCSYQAGSRRNTVYGLPSWLKDGQPIKGKEHDPDSLIDRPGDKAPPSYEINGIDDVKRINDLLRTPMIENKKDS